MLLRYTRKTEPARALRQPRVPSILAARSVPFALLTKFVLALTLVCGAMAQDTGSQDERRRKQEESRQRRREQEQARRAREEKDANTTVYADTAMNLYYRSRCDASARLIRMTLLDAKRQGMRSASCKK